MLIEMCFNVCPQGLLNFRKMLAAAESGNYEEASRVMLDSAWSQQAGARAQRLTEQMRTGNRT